MNDRRGAAKVSPVLVALTLAVYARSPTLPITITASFICASYIPRWPSPGGRGSAVATLML